MKKFNDTYCALDGAKQHITNNTVIMGGSKFISGQINSVAEKSDSEKEIKSIEFYPIDEKIITEVGKRFGGVYENKPDEYIVKVSDGKISVYANNENGKIYAASAIAGHYDRGIAEGLLYNAPVCEFRALKVYIPDREDIPFFKKVIDMCVYYGFNTLVWEIGGAMEYKNHPEINEGWVAYCENFKGRNGKAQQFQQSQKWNKNSIHWENGNGGFLTQEEIKELIAYCKEREIEIIPEIPSLSHCDYLLTRHPEIAENPEDPAPDTYCPSNPEAYKLLFEVLDEIIEVFNPKTVHIGHDELYQICVCDKCKDKNPAKLYAEDITKIHDYLKAKNIDTMIWGEKLLNAVTENGEKYGGAGVQTRRIISDKTVTMYGKEYPVYDEYWGLDADKTEGGILFEVPAMYEVISMVPKDLKIMNWYCNFYPKGDEEYHANKLWSVFGNFECLYFGGWFERIEKGVHGYSISNWSRLDKVHMQRNGVLFGMAYSSMMAWNREFDESRKIENIIAAADDVFRYYNKETLEGSYIEITHSTDEIIPHHPFVDGTYMDYNADCMGHYTVCYEDGTEERFPILWGLNIGVRNCDKEKYRTLIEPLCSCNFEKRDDGFYYKMIIPAAKEVKSVSADIFDKYKEKVFVKEIKIN